MTAPAPGEEIPFLRQLASSDRPAREKALDSLRIFLASNHGFTRLELLKLWRGLFFCMWHSDRPQTQQRLAISLAELVGSLRSALFVPFVGAFWTTLISNFHLIDSFRLDKFLLLMRNYVNAAFSYLKRHSWPTNLTSDYLQIIEEILMESQGKVGDGLRYHILDVWVDELDKVDLERKAPLEDILSIISKTKASGRTKTLRVRADDVLADKRLLDWVGAEK